MAIKLGDAVFFLGLDDKQLTKGVKNLRSRIGKDVAKLGKGMAVASGAVAVGLAFAVKSAADFNDRMSEVNTLGVSNLAALKEGVLDVAATFGKDLGETAAATYQVISATGLDVADTLKVLTLATRTSVAGVADLSDTVKLGTSVMNAFGLPVSDLESIFDKAFTAVKLGVTTIDELAQSSGKVSPLFVAAGLSVDEMFAAITTLTKGGLSTAESVTTLKATLTAILGPQEKAAEISKELGIEFSQAALEADGLQKFLSNVAEATKGNTKLTKELFGSTEALVGVLSIASDEKGFIDTLDAMADSAGNVRQGFKDFTKDNVSQQFRELTSSLKVVVVQIGDALLPILSDLVEAVKPIIETMTKWIKDNPELTGRIIKWGAAVAGIVLTIAGLAKGIGFLCTAFRLLTGPIGAIVGVGAIGWKIGGWLNDMAKKSEFLTKKLRAMGDFLFGLVEKLKEFFGIAGVGTGGGNLGTRTQQLIDAGLVTPATGPGGASGRASVTNNSTINAEIKIIGTGLDEGGIRRAVGGALQDLQRAAQFSRGGVAVTP